MTDSIIFFNNASYLPKRGFFSELIIGDTSGNIEEKILLNSNDSLSLLGWYGESSTTLLYDSLRNELCLIYHDIQNAAVRLLKYSLTDKFLLFDKQYRERLDKRDNIRAVEILSVSDGYIILGTTQWEQEKYKVYGFILKIDKVGNEVAWKILKGENDSYFFKNGFVDGSGFVTICGRHLNHGSSSKAEDFILTFSADNIEQVDLKVISNNQQNVALLNIFKRNGTYKGIGLHKPSVLVPAFPSLLSFDSEFKITKSVFFGIRDEELAKIKAEIPYQSTSDSDGNIYAATTSLIYSTPEKVDTESIEVITLTKFNSEGDIVWETIDSFEKQELGIKERWIRPVISSVNVASSGSVFVTGYYNDTEEVFIIDTFVDYYLRVYYDSLLMRDTFEILDSVKIDTITQLYRGVGFLFKYDKDGCRVSGCRIVDTQEETINEDKLVIYPNPTSGLVYLTLPPDFIGEINITNINGRSILKSCVSNVGNYTIDLKNETAGLYFVKISSKNGVNKIFKIIMIK